MAGITILAGHFGSGKTNLALNLMSLASAEDTGKVAAIDLDIINPYFRLSALAKSPSMMEVLSDNVRVFAPVFAETNLDVPALPAEIGAVFTNESYSSVIVDVGGDESGAIALGQYADNIKKCGYTMLFVVNKYRPFTSSEGETKDMLSRIEHASKLKFSGIAANPNLGAHTDAETVWESFEFYSTLSRQTGLDIAFFSVEKSLVSEVESALRTHLSTTLPITAINQQIAAYSRMPLGINVPSISRVPVFGIDIFTKPGWEIKN